MLKIYKMFSDNIEKINLCFLGVMVLLFPLCFIIQSIKWNLGIKIIYKFMCGAMLVYILVFGLYLISLIIGTIRTQISIKIKCDDPIFDKLDCYCKMRKSYSNMEYIKILNNYYSDEGPIMKMIFKEKKIDRLYRRKDFLEKAINRWNSVINFALSIFNGIILGFVTIGWQKNAFEYLDREGVIFNIAVYVALIIGIFLGIIGSMRGRMESYTHYISQYELELLNGLIRKLESQIIFDDNENIYIHEMKQFLLAFLFKKYRRSLTKKKRDNISEQMNEIDEAKFGDLSQKKYKEKRFYNDNRLRYYVCKEYKFAYKNQKNDFDDGYYVIYKYIKKYKKELKKFYEKSIVSEK